jgi:hypothetical protein
MSRIVNALISGLCLGFGIGSAFAEYWGASAIFFIATAGALFLFVRDCLRRVF